MRILEIANELINLVLSLSNVSIACFNDLSVEASLKSAGVVYYFSREISVMKRKDKKKKLDGLTLSHRVN